MNQKLGYKKAEVIVAGGGTGGACAAIAAARNGADVLLVEGQGFLGGLFTGGNMCVANWMPWAGLGQGDRASDERRGPALLWTQDARQYHLLGTPAP